MELLLCVAPSFVTELGCWIQALSISGGSNFTLSGLDFTNSQQKHIGMYGIVGVQVHGINITAPGDSPNTDGIYIRSCQHVTVSNSTIGTGNDHELERTGGDVSKGFRFPGIPCCSPPACRRWLHIHWKWHLWCQYHSDHLWPWPWHQVCVYDFSILQLRTHRTREVANSMKI